MRAQKYKTEAESFGWSFVFQDFVSRELKSKVTQRIEVVAYYILLWKVIIIIYFRLYPSYCMFFLLIKTPRQQLFGLLKCLFFCYCVIVKFISSGGLLVGKKYICELINYKLKRTRH